MNHPNLDQTLRQLRLSGLLQTLPVRLQEAAANRLSHADFLELIFQDEMAVRKERLLNRRLFFSHVVVAITREHPVWMDVAFDLDLGHELGAAKSFHVFRKAKRAITFQSAQREHNGTLKINQRIFGLAWAGPNAFSCLSFRQKVDVWITVSLSNQHLLNVPNSPTPPQQKRSGEFQCQNSRNFGLFHSAKAFLNSFCRSPIFQAVFVFQFPVSRNSAS
jgi:hypothetical protein